MYALVWSRSRFFGDLYKNGVRDQRIVVNNGRNMTCVAMGLDYVCSVSIVLVSVSFHK